MPNLRTRLSRQTGSLALATVVTSSLLLLMQHLIRDRDGVVDEPEIGNTLVFLPDLEEQPPEPKRQKPEKLPPPDVPPETDVEPPLEGAGHHGVEVTIPTFQDPPGPTVGPGIPDGDALPLSTVRPMYPERARRQGIEGYVVVRFSIDRLGRVTDVQVVEAVPRGVFDRAAVEAVKRFKYRPRVVNGKPLSVTGVLHRLRFELS